MVCGLAVCTEMGNAINFLYQGSVCLDSGSYLLNFDGCSSCGKKEPLKILDKSTEEDNDGEELVMYKRTFQLLIKSLSKYILRLHIRENKGLPILIS